MATHDDEPRQYVVAQLQVAFARDPRVNQLDVHVKLVGSKVFLTGCAPTRQRIDAITVVANEVLPGIEVHNEMIVASFAAPDEAENLS
ncbi:MAG TPA: BON domain-containing protein [Acidimicrobiales bacterium]